MYETSTIRFFMHIFFAHSINFFGTFSISLANCDRGNIIKDILFVLTSSKKKINIAKIRTNSHELHSEIGRWTIPRTPWEERIYHLYENVNIRMKITSSWSTLRTPTLDLSFIIFVAISTFLAF